MDSKTLKKVLGQVSHVGKQFFLQRHLPHLLSSMMPVLLCTSKHGMCACLSAKHDLQVNLPSWVNFPDFERVGWLNSVMGTFSSNIFVKSTSPHTVELSKTPTCCCHVCEIARHICIADMASLKTFWDSTPGHNLFLMVHSKRSCLSDTLITLSPYAHGLQTGCV